MAPEDAPVEAAAKRPLLLLALLAAFAPLATDMYLPAIPLLQQQWRQPLAVVNLTLVGFFVTYCLFLLIYGPLSDRFGRRPPLMTGIAVFVTASLLCALARNVTVLILARVLQAAGGAAASALSLALCKDFYTGAERERVLALLSVIIAVCPILAPMAGGALLLWFSWPWIFVLQGALAGIALAGVARMPEPLPPALRGSGWQSLGSYGRLLANRRYVGFVALAGLCSFPFFAFIAASPDVYMRRFGVSEQAFGYYYALNALALMGGAFACSRLVRRLPSARLLTWAFGGILAGGLWMLLGGHQGPFGLAAPMALVSFCLGLSRPPSSNLVLEQVERDVGAASAFMVFLIFLLGAAAMYLVSLGWTDKITVLGAFAAGSGSLALGLWLGLKRFTAAPPS